MGARATRNACLSAQRERDASSEVRDTITGSVGRAAMALPVIDGAVAALLIFARELSSVQLIVWAKAFCRATWAERKRTSL
jgi:hypothetical protein